MEPVGASLEGEWSCLSGIYTNEEADFMAQLLGSGFGVSSAFWSSNESGTIFNHDFSYINYNENLYSYSGGSSFCFSTSSDGDCEPVLVNNNNISISIHDVTNHTASYLVESIDNQYSWNMEIGNGNLEEYAQLPDHNLQPKIETEIPCSKPSAADKSNANPSEISKKKSKKEGDDEKIKRNVRSKKSQKLASDEKTKRNVRSKKSQKLATDEKTKRNVRSKKSQKLASSSNSSEEWNAAGLNGPAMSSCCSDDESNELNGGSGSSRLSTKSTPALNSNGKTRAGRGAATDPQSLYARKRRERINERLRILQNLVPNGTKVDISTMLEEAVHYVKFLQLQIKLPSSDDLWMYAPIAYKGMDIGLDRKLPAPL